MKKFAALGSMIALMAMFGAMPSTLTGCGGGGDDNTVTNTVVVTNAPAATTPSMSGVWHGSFNTGAEFSLSLSQSDNVLSGTYSRNDGSGSGSATGQINGNTLDLTTVRNPGNVISQWHGNVNDERTSSSGSWTIVSGDSGSGTFTMTK
jgi:hypothetical protein